MVRYTVVWQQNAEQELTTLWCNRTNRQAITDAANRLDAELANDSQQKGVELSERLRALSVPPLKVGFMIEEADRKVIVVMIKWSE